MAIAIPKQLAKWKNVISDIYMDGDVWNVGLKRGWINNLTETHQVFDGDLSETVRTFKNGWVEKCYCKECQ